MLQITFALMKRRARMIMANKTFFLSLMSFPVILLFFFILFISDLSLFRLGINLDYVSFILPGIVCFYFVNQSIWFGWGMILDRLNVIKMLKILPVKRFFVLLGLILGEFSFQLIPAIASLILIFFYFKISFLNGFFLLVFLVIFSIGFFSFSAAISYFFLEKRLFTHFLGTLSWALFIFSGTLYPMSQFTPILKILFYINPLFYAVDLVRYLSIGVHEINVWFALLAVLIFSLVSFVSASFLFDKKEFKTG